MFHRERADEERIEEIIQQALRQILAHEDYERFLDWARKTLPDALELEGDDLAPGEDVRLAVLLARAIWNATPLPASGFRPRPLADPDPDAPCPCGSGHAYGVCCAQIEGAPELPSDLMWELMLEELSERQLQQALADGAVPAHLLGLAAERWLAEDRPVRAVALLEPLFSKETDPAPDERFEPALNVLCDAYDRLDHCNKKREFLERMTTHGCRVLRATSWQRLSTIHIDEGDFLQAQMAFTQAQREGPDSPGTALLEITLLAAQHEDDLARNRAVFWRHKLKRSGFKDEEILGFLERAAEDPQDALMTSQSAIIDPLLLILRDWVQTAAERPLPSYGLDVCRDEEAPDAGGQLSLFGEPDAAGRHLPDPAHARMAKLCAPRDLHRLESHWRGVFNAPKPASIRLIPPLLEDLWEREDWVAFLAGHPETADSLDILDDLATALYLHPESALPWITSSLLTPVLERAAGILTQVLPEQGHRIIPWSTAENRPALRLLFRRYLFQMEGGQETAAAQTLRTLLRLNPRDNHGVRAELMNHYLRHGENVKALELARRFQDDLLADLAYGEVLALYRLGAQAEAKHALDQALIRLPRIPHYLTRKRVRRPDPGPANVTPGGDDQAWFYRQAMRDVWEAEPGILAWLKKSTA